MHTQTKRIIMGGLAAGLLAGAAFAAPMPMMDKPMTIMPDSIKWMPAPPGLPAGTMVAVLQGDPGKPGHFTMRAMMPAGTKIMPHRHSGAEVVTVLQGELKLGMGDKMDATKAKTLPAGAFFSIPPGHVHYAMSDEETIIQLTGMGPFDIIYVNPKDDPRNAKKTK